MAGMLGSAVIQEAISRVSSLIFNKREEKESREHSIERLEMAHNELDLAMERTGKMPITDVSLLRRRKILKRAFEECSDVLKKCKEQLQEDEGIEQEQPVIHSSFPKRVAHATKSSIINLFTLRKDGPCCSDVRRFEWLADCAGKFVRDVESGCSLRRSGHHTFCSPFLRQLFQGKTLRYEGVQGSQLRDIYMWPISFEERGIEAELSYKYENYIMPEKSFHLRFILRLSESTDLVGTAIKCLQYLASQFKVVAETAMGELSLLPDLHDIYHSYAPPWVGIQESHTRLTQVCRPDPLCCKSNGHDTCSKNIICSELSNIFPEQVICISLQYMLHALADEAGRDDLNAWSPPLQLRVGFMPHGVWKGLKQSHELEVITGKGERRDGNIDQEIETLRSKIVDCLIHQPELAYYNVLWQYLHGFAFFDVWTSAMRLTCFPKLKDRSDTQRVAKRRR